MHSGPQNAADRANSSPAGRRSSAVDDGELSADDQHVDGDDQHRPEGVVRRNAKLETADGTAMSTPVPRAQVWP